MRIAWGITGAGHYLKDSFDVFKFLVPNRIGKQHTIGVGAGECSGED